MKELLKNWILKLTCRHNWKELKHMNVYMNDEENSLFPCIPFGYALSVVSLSK